MKTEPLEALNKHGYWGFINNCNPVCPHCGETYYVAKNYSYELCEEGEHTIECLECEREYLVSTQINITYNTDTEIPI